MKQIKPDLQKTRKPSPLTNGFKECRICNNLAIEFKKGEEEGFAAGFEEGNQEGYSEGKRDGENYLMNIVTTHNKPATTALNRIAHLLNMLTNEKIKLMTDKERETAFYFFLTYAKKFTETGEHHE